MKSKSLGTDLLFVFQLFMAWLFGIPQAIRLLESTEGVTINWMLCATIFVFLNWVLAWKNKNTREESQVFWIYTNWVVVATPLVVISFIRCQWTGVDTLVFGLILTSAFSVIVVGHKLGRKIGDPVIKGILVGLFRVVPHLYLAYCIVKAGSGDGIAGKAILAANITATTRIVSLCLSGRKTMWSRSLKASFLSEVANEGSWLLVTVIWLVY